MKKTLTKADIVEAIYEETDRNRVDVKTVVEKLLELMKNEESITLPSRKVIVFRLSRKFRSELNPE